MEVPGLFLIAQLENPDFNGKPADVCEMLCLSFLQVYVTKAESSHDSRKFSQASREEGMLTMAKAVRLFYEKASIPEYKAFFRGSQHASSTAIFVHKLLESLTGNSQLWFRKLQMESLDSCRAVVSAIDCASCQSFAPGIISSIIKYMKRANEGKDSPRVRLRAIELLRATLDVSFSSVGNPGWWDTAIGHLHGGLKAILDPSAIVRDAYNHACMDSLLQLVSSLLLTEPLQNTSGVPTRAALSETLQAAYLVLENLVHLRHLSDAVTEEGTTPGRSRQKDISLVLNPHTTCSTIGTLSGEPLMHAATSALRHREIRQHLISSENSVNLMRSVFQKCTRFVGISMTAEDLSTDRVPRQHPAGVVDEFLECLAHSLAEFPVDADNNEETAGESITNALLDDSNTMLEDWDLYMAHPATIYTTARFFMWQFKPIPRHLRPFFGDASDATDSFPTPVDFVTTGAFEHLWTILAQPHLWNVEEDENLCSFQQLQHRRTVACCILRALNVMSSTIMEPAVLMGEAGIHAFRRVGVVTLYLILEKAAAGNEVHTAAMHCLEAYGRAAHITPLEYFISSSALIVDDASRAIKEESLRRTAVSVLRGAISYVVESVAMVSDQSNRFTRSASFVGTNLSSFLLVQQRMSSGEMAALLKTQCVPANYVSCLSDFVSAAVGVTTECMQIAKLEGSQCGVRAALILLRDCFDITSLLNFSTPLLAMDEDQERESTSQNPQLQLLQLKCHHAMLQILAFCTSCDDAAPLAIEACVHGFTAFVTNDAAVRWAREFMKEEQTRLAAAHAKSSSSKKTEQPSEEEEEAQQSLPPPPETPWDLPGCHIVLPRSQLKTVYRVYLSFLAILKEPITLLTTTPYSPKTRTKLQQRMLEAIPLTPTVFAVLDGLEGLGHLAHDFLIHRYVSDVLPLVLVWHARGTVMSIPTDREIRLQKATELFAERLHRACSSQLKTDVEVQCAAYFTLAVGKGAQ